ncbi:MAG TPA: NAD(P)-dependent alcohol dehydrogenase [Nocardioides sp.]|uniref:quinone oxidoreductase family protein n=1 Tax=Nocardioides sp. TaxID=35761 RepID=UPI002C619100|nr:NAD(P)-dependent alcohol dehydrogenase [Nocardioides sp.]HTW13500.1 NAD(P)-dependent alcohol dehydrogenase [Nocardioides sp.]
MRAWVRESYGGPGVLRLEERPDPVAGPGELLVRVHASTVNRTDLAYLTGRPWVNRAVCGWPRPRAWARVLGSEYAGVVEAVGPGVTSYAVGDRVCGFADGRPGAHAERVVVAADSLVARLPGGWSFAGAAPAMEGAHYALAMPRVARTRPGDRVLILGATGAIGSALVQLLVADDVAVTAVSDQPLPDALRELPVTEEVAGPYDVVADAAGKSSFAACRHLLAPRGTYVSSDLGRGGVNLLLAAAHPRVRFPVPKAGPEVATEIAGRMAAGSYRPLIDRTYAFDELPAAYAYVATGRKVGNVVVTHDAAS